MADVAFPVAQPAETFKVGRILWQCLSILRRNSFKLFVVVLALRLPSLMLFPEDFSILARQHNPDGKHSLILLADIISDIVEIAILTVGVVSAAETGRVKIIQSARGLRRLGSVIVLYIVFYLALAAGFVAFIVPGLILLTMWFVALPACVAEGLSPFASFRRSRQLTKGFRLQLLGITLLIGIFEILGAAVVIAFAKPATREAANALSLAWYSSSDVAVIVITTVAYHQLRAARDGLASDRISAVFD